jgi:hypothetical protein
MTHEKFSAVVKAIFTGSSPAFTKAMKTQKYQNARYLRG